MPTSKSLIAITAGDPQGIGPEVTAKALDSPAIKKLNAEFLIFGDPQAIRKFSRAPSTLSIAPPPRSKSRHRGGFESGWAIEQATRLVLDKSLSALVTGPISKERLRQGGWAFNGHTDFLSMLCGEVSVTMMLANPKARVSLVTVHQSLRSVSDSLTGQAIERAVLHTVNHLQIACGIKKPHIAVTGLNPHAGENGLLGREEKKIISPAIKRLRTRLGRRAKIEGPVAADTAFVNISKSPLNYLPKYDAVVAMYHDQGLGPVKALDFANTVNLTLGLPIIRTSVDHGTAFDIAGRGTADPRSMIAAIQMAHRWAQTQNRKRRIE